MSYLLELLGKGLETPLMHLVLPFYKPLTGEEISLLRETMEQDPAQIANKLRLGIHYAQSGAADQAEYIFNEIIKKHPEYIEARLAWAAVHAETAELDKAFKQLKQARSVAPEDGRIYFCLGYCCERLGDMSLAQEYYLAGLNHRPYLRRTRQRLGALQLAWHDYDKAIDHCRELEKEHPEDIWNYLVLGQMSLQIRQYEQAEDYFERALTIDPENFEVQDDEVDMLARTGRIEEAIERMQKIIREQGDFPDSIVQLADLYSQIRDDRAAVNSYLRALEIHPGYLEAAVKLGTQHMRMGRFYEAASQFNQAVEINDRLIGAYVGLGLAQHHLDKREQAKDTFDLAAALVPNTNLLFTEMNRLQQKVAKSQKPEHHFSDLDMFAITDPHVLQDILEIQMQRYRKKLQENPSHANIHYHYGLLQQNQGHNESALEHFEQALTVNPSFFKARLKFGLTLRDTERSDQSLEQLQKAFQLDNQSIDLHYQLGLMFCDKIKFALAVEYFENSLDNELQNGDVQANLSLALQNMGLIDRATAAWRSVCELEPQSSLAFQAQRSIPSLNQNIL